MTRAEQARARAAELLEAHGRRAAQASPDAFRRAA